MLGWHERAQQAAPLARHLTCHLLHIHVQIDPGAEELLASMLARHPAQRPTVQQARTCELEGRPLSAVGRMWRRLQAASTSPRCSWLLRTCPACTCRLAAQVVDRPWFQAGPFLCYRPPTHRAQPTVHLPSCACPAQIIDHPWFQQDLPPGALTLNDEILARTVDDPALADRWAWFAFGAYVLLCWPSWRLSLRGGIAAIDPGWAACHPVSRCACWVPPSNLGACKTELPCAVTLSSRAG